jgi:hypothetical protein
LLAKLLLIKGYHKIIIGVDKDVLNQLDLAQGMDVLFSITDDENMCSCPIR